MMGGFIGYDIVPISPTLPEEFSERIRGAMEIYGVHSILEEVEGFAARKGRDWADKDEDLSRKWWDFAHKVGAILGGTSVESREPAEVE